MKVELLGTSFTLQSDESPEYLEKVVEYYERKVEEIHSSVTTSDPVKQAILAGFLLVDEIMKTQGADSSQTSQPSPAHSQQLAQQHSSDLEEAERITLELIKKIDDTLETAAIYSTENDE